MSGDICSSGLLIMSPPWGAELLWHALHNLLHPPHHPEELLGTLLHALLQHPEELLGTLLHVLQHPEELLATLLHALLPHPEELLGTLLHAHGHLLHAHHHTVEPQVYISVAIYFEWKWEFSYQMANFRCM